MPPIADTHDSAQDTGWRWPAFIVALLGAQAVFGTFVVFIAVSDPSHAVEPGYYQRGLRWDETQAAQRASDALGWSAEVTTNAAHADASHALEVRIRDRQGDAIADAEVTVAIFHHARGNDVTRLKLETALPGLYHGAVPHMRAGLWRVTVEARRGEDLFLLEVDHEQRP